MREKHGAERKCWIKVHVAVDVETRRPITFEITDERTTDQEMVKPLPDKVSMAIQKSPIMAIEFPQVYLRLSILRFRLDPAFGIDLN